MAAVVNPQDWCAVCKTLVDPDDFRAWPTPSLCWRCRLDLRDFARNVIDKLPPQLIPKTELEAEQLFVEVKLQELAEKRERKLSRRLARWLRG